MTILDSALPPAQRIAVAYAPLPLRSAFALLLAFDRRLMDVAARGQEVLLKQMRFAWWREQLGKPAAARARGEPLLAQLDQVPAHLDIVKPMMLIVDAWDISLSDSDEARKEGAKLRSSAIFGTYAEWAGAEEERRVRALGAGVQWARATFESDFVFSSPRPVARLKPLNLLLLSAYAEAANNRLQRAFRAVRMSIHALTGL